VLLGVERGGVVLEMLYQSSRLGPFIEHLGLPFVDAATAVHGLGPGLENVLARLPGRGVLKASVSLRGAPWRSRSFFFQEPATASRSPASSAPAVVSLPRPADNPDRAPPVPAHQKNNNRPAAADPTGRTSLTRMRREAIAPPHRRGYLTTTSGAASANGANPSGATAGATPSGATTRPLSGWPARSRREAQSSAPHRPRSRRRREALRTRESQSKTRVDPFFAPTFRPKRSGLRFGLAKA